MFVWLHNIEVNAAALFVCVIYAFFGVGDVDLLPGCDMAMRDTFGVALDTDGIRLTAFRS